MMQHDKVFDGHNDVLWRLYEKDKADVELDFIAGDGEGHLDLPRMRAGGFAAGLFAIYIPNEEPLHLDGLMQGKTYNVPLPPEVKWNDALPIALEMLSIFQRIELASAGAFTICRTGQNVRQAMEQGSIAAILHMEGAEPIDRNFETLETFYGAGLRSLGPVWSRPNIFGHGVPFKFPSTGDTGPGLTDLGKALIVACSELGIAIDLSHISEKGFWDVARISQKPLIASHSNPFALCKSARNLSDTQLAAIAETGGIVGLNFATCFLNEDGQENTPTKIETMLRHLDYLIAKLGEDHVGFGSDFDGANVPHEIDDVAGLPNLLKAMRLNGYNESLMQKLTHQNWISVLEKTWQD
jgi:membrane dipeptidase